MGLNKDFVTLSNVIGNFTAETDFDRIPTEVCERAKLCVLDTIGCILLGAGSSWANPAKEYLRQTATMGSEAHVLGFNRVACASVAAFVNGVLSHIYDLDDVFWGVGHPSVAVLPATFALAETRQASGKDFLTAFALGWEVACHLSQFFSPWHRRKGLYPSATIGIFGAVIGAAKILKLNPQRTSWALGLAACQSAGLMGSFGTMAKPFTIGRVGSNGVMAAVMAESGMNSSESIFEGQHGYLGAYTECNENEVESIKEGFGAPWKMLEPGILFKQYPSCTGTHPGIEAVLELKQIHLLSPENVSSVRILTDQAGLDMLKFEKPKDALEAQFSMHFCIALAISEGKVIPEQFTERKLRNPDLLALMDRITMDVHPELKDRGYLNRSDTTVVIKLKDGAECSQRVRLARGNPERPFSATELEHKFLKCASATVGEKTAEKAVQFIRYLESMASLNNLGDLLSSNSKE